MVKLAKPVTWSYSALTTYEQCPLLYKYKYIDKIKEETTNEHLVRGNAVHKAAEQYVRGDVSKLAPTLRKFDTELKALRKEKTAMVEQSWGFTKNWVETGWVADDTWVRVKMDCSLQLPNNTFKLIDYKTGRERPEEHKDQIMLYGVAGYAKNPGVDLVIGEMWYVDSGKITSYTIDRKLSEKYKKQFTGRATAMLGAKAYNPRQSHACQWCQFSKRNGGGCKY